MEYERLSDELKGFYSRLGWLSTRFAIMEAGIMQILSRYILDDFVLTQTLFEKNSLHVNLEILTKIIKIRSYDSEISNQLIQLIQKVHTVKTKRNLFVHSIWNNPINKDGELYVTCIQSRLSSIHDVVNDIKGHSSITKEVFSLSQIIEASNKIEEIIDIEEILLKKLEDIQFDY